MQPLSSKRSYAGTAGRRACLGTDASKQQHLYGQASIRYNVTTVYRGSRLRVRPASSLAVQQQFVGSAVPLTHTAHVRSKAALLNPSRHVAFAASANGSTGSISDQQGPVPQRPATPAAPASVSEHDTSPPVNRLKHSTNRWLSGLLLVSCVVSAHIGSISGHLFHGKCIDAIDKVERAEETRLFALC